MSKKVVIAAVFGCLCFDSAIAQTINRRLYASEAVYELHVANPAFQRCDTNRDGAFQPAELACYDAFPIKAAYLPPPPVEPTAPLIEVAVRPGSQAAPSPAEAAEPDPLAAGSESFFIIRRSRAAIGSFANPKPFDQAAGAEFAWADDRIVDNEVWSARGIVAASFVRYGEVQRHAPYVDTLTVAPYVNFDRVSNSRQITGDIDNLIYGGVFEAGFANVFGATHYVDISGEYTSSFAGDAKNWSVDVEWQPVGGVNPEGGNTLFSYFGTPLPLGRYFVFAVAPSVQAQYVGELGDVAGQPIFAERDEAFRAGPSVTLSIDGIKEFEYVPWWIQRLHYEISYGYLYDWLSGRDYELLDTSLSFALDPDGHLGLTFSYRNGQLEATGQEVDLTTIALSVSY